MKEIEEKSDQVDSESPSEKVLSEINNSKDLDHESSSDDPEVNQLRGALRTEQFMSYINSQSNRLLLLSSLYLSIYLLSWCLALRYSIVTSLDPLATSSYSEHSEGLASLSIATSIISAVCKPFIAKIADSISRPFCYLIVLIFMILGSIIVAASNSISAYIVGAAMASVGSSGIDFLNALVVADLSPLKWRGFVNGLLGTPYIYNCWFASLIVADLEVANWRWGYGMFAIMMPVVAIPALVIMLVYEAKADKTFNPHKTHKTEKRHVLKLIYNGFLEVDGLGLLLMGFGFSLLLLPLSLYSSAQNGWKNPSLIAMFVVGGVLLFAFVAYEIWFSPFPLFPKKDWNRTFISAVVLNFFYAISNDIALLYFSSYTYVVRDFSLKNWSYFNNAYAVSLYFFSTFAGLVFRYTHRYKLWEILGMVISIIGSGILLNGKEGATGLGALAANQVLTGMGGAFAALGATVALQASVPHSDLGVAMSILNLLSSLAASIGYAIAAVIWQNKMVIALRKYLPSSVSDADVLQYYGSIDLIVLNPFGSEIREGAIKAYKEVSYYLFAPALGILFCSLIATFFQANYYLGDQRNAVDDGSEEEPQKKVSVLDDLRSLFQFSL
ncbi:uncharacterized protein V1516DRAFT_622153 [Lipomyces oligophaga]|uniref:uncharacterized protein n=1 Tax=Lipomyces oligophaga TaxID=45792 RepID=UPI0034CE036A